MKTTSTKYILLSKKGMKELKKSLTRLECDRKKVIQELHELDKTIGHEERLIRIEKLMTLEGIEFELEEKKRTLSRARPLPTRRARLKVAIGSVVDLIDQQGRLFSYTIVNSIEANPSDGRISATSPLGSSLLGKTVHDIVQWSNGLDARQFKLVRIS